MVEEIINFLNPQPGYVYIDATCGTGHHSRAILEYTNKGCTMICVDKDPRAIMRAQKYLADFSGSVIFINDGFENIERIMQETGIKKANGILFDLGFSSEQISDPEAGFGFRQDGPLDMRFDRNYGISAYDVVNRFSKEQLRRILFTFGEIKEAERIARLICDERKKKFFETTRELADFLAKNIRKRTGIHPATRVFQAIRIFVNRELENLETALKGALNILASGARIIVISYHSLEDRIVKNFFKSEKRINVLTKKPVVPGKIEKTMNPSARSAKMRVGEVLP